MDGVEVEEVQTMKYLGAMFNENDHARLKTESGQ